MTSPYTWEFIIRGKPISQKNFKRVGVSKGKGYMYTPKSIKEWHKEAKEQLEMQLKHGAQTALPEKTNLEVKIISYMGKGQSIDVDNLAGGPLDAMQKAGVYKNDYWIKRLTLERDKDPEDPRVEIDIKIFEENKSAW